MNWCIEHAQKAQASKIQDLLNFSVLGDVERLHDADVPPPVLAVAAAGEAACDRLLLEPVAVPRDYVLSTCVSMIFYQHVWGTRKGALRRRDWLYLRPRPRSEG